MRRICRYSTISRLHSKQGSLDDTIKQLTLRIQQSQDPKSPSLLTSIDILLDKYETDLATHLHIAPQTNPSQTKQRIWDILSIPNLSDHEVLQKRNDLFLQNSTPSLSSPEYIRFVKSIYPLTKPSNLPLKLYQQNKIMDLPHNTMKYHLVNHDQVFKAYTDLPSPKPYQMRPKDFEHFMQTFMFGIRKFIRPNLLTKSYIDHKTPKQIVENFNQMLSYRNEYFRMVSKIMNDLKTAQLPLTISEQNQFFYMLFFKDKSSIVQKVDECYEKLIDQDIFVEELKTFPTFDYGTFDQITQSMDIRNTETFNLLLFLAIRHDQKEVIEKMVNLVVEDTKSIPNTKTYQLLLEHLAGVLDGSLKWVLESLTDMDINLVNSIIKALVNSNHIHLAEYMVLQLFTTNSCPDDSEDSESVVYKQLTAEDKLVYDKWRTTFENIKIITGDTEISYKLVPTENTFRHLIKNYCNESTNEAYTKVKTILNILETFHLPITTRIYKMIFTKFSTTTSELWNLRELIELTSKLISSQDYMYASSNDASIFNQRMDNLISNIEISRQLKGFVETNLEPSSGMKLPNERGNFIKLSDDLIERLYNAFIATIKRKMTTESAIEQGKMLLRTIREQKANLDHQLLSTRRADPNYSYTSSKQDVYYSDEVTYIKKGFLIDLIDIVYSTEL